jgi:hypothetical protein
MHRNRITGPASVHASQHTQIKLVDIARWTVEEHKSTLPEPPDFSRSRRTSSERVFIRMPGQPAEEPP